MQLGELNLKDYLSIVQPRRAWRRVAFKLVAAAACILCFCAGRYGPWTGKGAADLSLSAALEVLNVAPVEAWERELGVYAVHKNVTRALDVLAEVAREPTNAGRDASLNLRHLTRGGIRRIRELAASVENQDVNVASIRMMQEDLK